MSHFDILCNCKNDNFYSIVNDKLLLVFFTAIMPIPKDDTRTRLCAFLNLPLELKLIIICWLASYPKGVGDSSPVIVLADFDHHHTQYTYYIHKYHTKTHTDRIIVF